MRPISTSVWFWFEKYKFERLKSTFCRPIDTDVYGSDIFNFNGITSINAR